MDLRRGRKDDAMTNNTVATREEWERARNKLLEA
jgi:hypothetical protein